MKICQSFKSIDRYFFDLNLCSYAKGFAQFDTPQDAWYFGIWCNPYKLEILEYCEGDITRKTCASSEEFCTELRRISLWNMEHHQKPALIDPGLMDAMKQKFMSLGLSDLMHA